MALVWLEILPVRSDRRVQVVLEGLEWRAKGACGSKVGGSPECSVFVGIGVVWSG